MKTAKPRRTNAGASGAHPPGCPAIATGPYLLVPEGCPGRLPRALPAGSQRTPERPEAHHARSSCGVLGLAPDLGISTARAARRRLARVLHSRRGMHTTPSLWLVTGRAVGSFAAVVAAAVHAA